jgi:methylated-DNA-[protein]-cysteine S-methyltransferase
MAGQTAVGGAFYAMSLAIGCHESPLGPLAVATEGDLLIAIDLAGDDAALATRLAAGLGGAGAGAPSSSVLGRLRAYFDGDLKALDAIEVRPVGTSFQQCVWTALRGIRAGSTTSYSALAAHIGRPAAVRAVGAANGANPIPIVIPCHRVIGADGRLVGYGGGLDRKRWLLAHEGVVPRSLL